MATYTSAQMRNSGSLGEALSGAKTFTITNVTNSLGQRPVGYLTLEGNATANQNITSTSFLTGSFGTFSGAVDQESLVTSSTHWSISVGRSGSYDNPSQSLGSFTFTPTNPVAVNSYYIKATGNFSLTIS